MMNGPTFIEVSIGVEFLTEDDFLTALHGTPQHVTTHHNTTLNIDLTLFAKTQPTEPVVLPKVQCDLTQTIRMFQK